MPQISTQDLESIASLEGPLGAALYAVLPYEAVARELERVGASLRRNFEGAAQGNRAVVAGQADLRNGVVPEELMEQASARFVQEVTRLVSRLDGALNEVANARQAAAVLNGPDVDEKIAGIVAIKEALQAFLVRVNPVVVQGEG